MHVCTYIYIYTYISQHVDPQNINVLCLGGNSQSTFVYFIACDPVSSNQMTRIYIGVI